MGSGELPSQPVHVYVNQEDEETAIGVAEIFERHLVRHRLDKSPYDDEPYEVEDHEHELWRDWPLCPRCKRRRVSRCPSCLDSSRDFPLGHVPELVTDKLPDPVVLICTTCDEAFTPEFFDRCVDCDHEFPGGLPTPPKKQTPPINWSRNIGLALIGAFLVGLYWLVMRRR